MLTTYGQCPMWALDTTNKKFKVPTIKDGSVIQQAMSDSAIGKAFNAGLPNITGSLTVSVDISEVASSGVFTHASIGGKEGADGDSGVSTKFTLDTSKSSSIYGNSSTVQMNAVALRYFVVVATKAINASTIDWSNWASSLASKLNADHSNDTKPYLTETYRNGTSWYRVWSDGWCEQGGYSNFAGGGTTITFTKPYKSNPTITLGHVTGSTSYYATGVSIDSVTTTNFKAHGWHRDGNSDRGAYWHACGSIV